MQTGDENNKKNNSVNKTPKIIKKKVVKKPVNSNQEGEKPQVKKPQVKKQNTEIKKHIQDSTEHKHEAENQNIVSAVESSSDKKKKLIKKKLVKKSKSQRFLKKYGLLLLVFFLFSTIYLSWLYIVPFVLNGTITSKEINNFVEQKIGFRIDYKDCKFYTSHTFDIGVKFRDLKLLYPGSSILNDKGLFLKSRLVTIEMPFIPYLLKTIRFNEFSFRTAMVNLYQDESGRYVYIDNLKTRFNPQMPKYILEIPTIEIYSYNMSNFNKKTGQFKKNRGDSLQLKPTQIKPILQEAPKSTTIMLR